MKRLAVLTHLYRVHRSSLCASSPKPVDCSLRGPGLDLSGCNLSGLSARSVRYIHTVAAQGPRRCGEEGAHQSQRRRRSRPAQDRTTTGDGVLDARSGQGTVQDDRG